ncbi:MAG: GntR family transcriptional regulator [bacterium]|nr:GntR family transcriptional regulator [bacterium]
MSLAGIVEEQIRKQIVDGKYKEGDKLPSLKELALIFNVSSITVRSAIDNLAREGFVTKKRGSGYYALQGLQSRQPVVAVLLSDKLEVGSFTRKQHYHFLIETILKENSKKGYNYHVLVIDNKQPVSVQMLRSIDKDAVIFSGIKLATSIVNYLKQESVPYVCTNWAGENVISLDFDHSKFVNENLDYLVANNHRKIGLLIRKTLVRDVYKHVVGYFHKGMFDRGLPVSHDLVYTLDDENGYPDVIIDNILKRKERLTALYCWGVAEPVIERLKKRGIRIPEDISIVAYGNELFPNKYNVTGHQVEMHRIAEEAMKIIALQLRREDCITIPAETRLDGKWIEGSTVKRIE